MTMGVPAAMLVLVSLLAADSKAFLNNSPSITAQTDDEGEQSVA